jgi:hypothetical protein
MYVSGVENACLRVHLQHNSKDRKIGPYTPRSGHLPNVSTYRDWPDGNDVFVCPTDDGLNVFCARGVCYC